MYYKTIENGYIVAITTGVGHISISEEEYQTISALVRNTPEAPDGYDYKLRANNLEWELVELPPEPPEPDPDIDDAEALAILLGGAV